MPWWKVQRSGDKYRRKGSICLGLQTIRTCIIGNDANIAAVVFDFLLVFRSSDKASLSEEMTLLPNNDTSSCTCFKFSWKSIRKEVPNELYS